MPELRPDAALFEIAQFVPQFGRGRRGDEFLQRRSAQRREGRNDLRGQHLHEDGVVGVDGEQEFDRVRVRHLIMIGQFADFVLPIVNVVPADLAEENLPLAEERPRLGAVGRADQVVHEPDTLLGALTFGAEVGGQILGRERQPARPQRHDGPQQALDRVRRHGNRVFGVELRPVLAHKQERIAVAAHAEDAFHADVLRGLKVPEPLPDLSDDGLDARRVLVLRDLARAFRVFVLDDHAAVFRIDASAGQAVFMPARDVQPGFRDELVDERIAGMAHVFLGTGPGGGPDHLIGHDRGVRFDQCFERLIHATVSVPRHLAQ